MIAIHSENTDFSKRWINYCKEKEIPYKIVNCYDTDIVDQVRGCTALFWHHNHRSFEDLLFAKQLLFALEHAGVKVFPDFKTGWHFDDKVAQKYLFEAVGVPTVPTYVFYDKLSALEWAKSTSYPKVFKLRGGAGSSNVRLVKSFNENKKLINKAFGKGFPAIDKKGKVLDAFKKFKEGTFSFTTVLKVFYLMYIKPSYYTRMVSNEKGYVYYQDFIPNNDSDIRVIIVDDKAFAIKRMVRKNDFRASGSGKILYDKKHFNDKLIKLSFQVADKIKSKSCALDYVFIDGRPLIVEVSYGFSSKAYDPCVGYWDRNLVFHEGTFNPYGWMIESVLNK